MNSETQKIFVNLQAKDTKKVSRKFELNQANAILSLPNSQWKLDDKNFSWNGKDISKVNKK